MTELTPRQIEVLTEIFDGSLFDWRSLTSAQRTGRNRVLDTLRGWNTRIAHIDRKTGDITLRGLTELEPHYTDRPKIAAAIEARRALETEREATAAREAQEKADAAARRIERRNARLIEGYRRILADHHFDHADRPDDLILRLGNAMVDFEMCEANAQ